MNICLVSRKKYGMLQKWFEKDHLPYIRSCIKKEYGIKFEHKLVGSGKTKLVMATDNGGFDLDYLFIFKEKDISKLDLGQFKNNLMRMFNDTFYIQKHVEDSTSVITVRFTDREHSTRLCGLDIALAYLDENEDLHILVHDKHKNLYNFETVKDLSNVNRKAKNLHHNKLWNELREEYVKLKLNEKHSNLCSYQVYTMAINNVYGRYKWK